MNRKHLKKYYLVETQGGLALDVNSANITPRLLETYLKVKERGLL